MKMALKIYPLFTTISPQLSNTSTTTTLLRYKFKTRRISCSNSISDAALASELAAKVGNINTKFLESQEAMKKSKRLLFGELCEYLDLKEDEVKKKWRKMETDEKSILVKRFVSEWSINFHPLSAKCVKDMVDEYLREESSSRSPPPSASFPGLRRIMGFPENK